MMKTPIKTQVLPSNTCCVFASTDDLQIKAVGIYNDDLYCGIDNPFNNCQEEETLLLSFQNVLDPHLCVRGVDKAFIYAEDCANLYSQLDNWYYLEYQ